MAEITDLTRRERARKLADELESEIIVFNTIVPQLSDAAADKIAAFAQDEIASLNQSVDLEPVARAIIALQPMAYIEGTNFTEEKVKRMDAVIGILYKFGLGRNNSEAEIASLENRLLLEATGHMKTQASLKAATDRWMEEQDLRKKAEAELASARQEERDSIIKAVCLYCRDEDWEPTELVGGRWQHKYKLAAKVNSRFQYDPCDAGPIHERAQAERKVSK